MKNLNRLFMSILLSTTWLSHAMKPIVIPSFHLTQVKNGTTQEIEVVATNKTILKIPAGKTVNTDIELKTREGFVGREIVPLRFVSKVNGKPRNIKLYAERSIDGAQTNVTTTFGIYLNDIHALASEKLQFALKNNENEEYAIQLHFIEDAKGNIVPAHDTIDVTAIIK